MWAECPKGVEDHGTVLRALDWFEQGADFADALHLAACDGTQTHTFDERYCKQARQRPEAPAVQLTVQQYDAAAANRSVRRRKVDRLQRQQPLAVLAELVLVLDPDIDQALAVDQGDLARFLGPSLQPRRPSQGERTKNGIETCT